LIDSFPIEGKSLKRRNKGSKKFKITSLFLNKEVISYNASKDKFYFGFKQSCLLIEKLNILIPLEQILKANRHDIKFLELNKEFIVSLVKDKNKGNIVLIGDSAYEKEKLKEFFRNRNIEFIPIPKGKEKERFDLIRKMRKKIESSFSIISEVINHFVRKCKNLLSVSRIILGSILLYNLKSLLYLESGEWKCS